MDISESKLPSCYVNKLDQTKQVMKHDCCLGVDKHTLRKCLIKKQCGFYQKKIKIILTLTKNKSK